MPRRRNLVVVRAGARSLHPCWLDRSAPRSWDLYLLPFEDLPRQDGHDLTVGDVIAGPKWSGLGTLLNGWQGWRDYDYVWLPDDDLYADQATITAMFDVARALELQLFAPALHETSYYAHFSTMRNPRFHVRRVGFVEIMAPAFSRTALERLLPTLDLTETGWGWGLDSVWPKLLDYEGVAVLDGTPVLHTRPVGEMREGELARAVHRESDRLLDRYGCQQVHTTFAAFGAELEPLPLPPEHLLVHLVEGWRYLIERDPRVLSWIAAYQQRAFPWPDYPVAGLPAGPGTEMASAGS